MQYRTCNALRSQNTILWEQNLVFTNRLVQYTNVAIKSVLILPINFANVMVVETEKFVILKKSANIPTLLLK
jgi:hypothetical protein